MWEYRAHLRRFFWRRIAPTLVGSGFVVGFMLGDLRRFTTSGSYFVNPILAVFAVLAALSLGLVALTATWTITRHTSIWRESADGR